MSKKVQNIVMSQYIDDLAQVLSKESHFLMKEQEKTIGIRNTKALMAVYLARFVKLMLLETLNEKPTNINKLSREDIFKYTSNNFSEIKTFIQDAVSTGFQGALANYSGKSVEYYCLIKPVPSPVNKEPC